MNLPAFISLSISRLGFFLSASIALFSSAPAADIIKDGTPNAEIVVASERPRMATFAALELQYNLKKISGAELPIVTKPSDEVPIQIYVGKSPSTEKLGLDTKGLEYGAYRMVSGDNYLALFGDDKDFTPPEPWAKSRADRDRALADWDAVVAKSDDISRGFPFNSMYKNFYHGPLAKEGFTARYGTASEHLWPDGDFSSGFWLQDKGGTFNAVCGFLNSLGVRWYMPGELGEILPVMKTIALPSEDETVKPAYPLRAWCWYVVAATPFENILWYWQIGDNSGEEILGPDLIYAHGLTKVHEREDFKARFPNAFALVGKKRDTEHRGFGTACYSSPELVDQTVKYARFLFDTYNVPQISVWPADGFKTCQCELCAGKDRADLVWSFVDRVSRELYKTHPDRLVTCGAYTPYQAPPASIEKFSPNVAVFLANWGRSMLMDEDTWKKYQEYIKAWQSRLAPGHILRVENNRWSLHGGEDDNWRDPFPVPHARAIARELRTLNGISLGEISEQSQLGGELINPAINSFPLYVMARWFWNPDTDFEKTLEEYLTEFYGPAADEMKKAYLFSEDAYIKAVNATTSRTARTPGNVPVEDRIKFVEMLQVARAKAGDSVYGKRIDLFLNELQSMETLQALLKKKGNEGSLRDNAMIITLPASGETKAFPFKENISQASPLAGTTVRVSKEKDALVFTIRCAEPDMANLTATRDVYTGDSVAILLEPPGRSYYQIEVSPDGVVYDSDRATPVAARWDSRAEVSTERGKDFWQVRVKTPYVSPETGEGDPNHYVVGLPPSEKNPWYFNVGRSRPRDGKTETSMLSPTGMGGYHKPDKFAKLVVAEAEKPGKPADPMP